jgi:hypothetical protein
MFGAPDLVSEDEVPIPRLHVPFPGDLLLMLRQPHLQIVMLNLRFCIFQPDLLWFRVIVMTSFFSAPHAFLSLLLPLFPCSPLPCPAGFWPWPMPSWIWSVSMLLLMIWANLKYDLNEPARVAHITQLLGRQVRLTA